MVLQFDLAQQVCRAAEVIYTEQKYKPIFLWAELKDLRHFVFMCTKNNLSQTLFTYLSNSVLMSRWSIHLTRVAHQNANKTAGLVHRCAWDCPQ